MAEEEKEDRISSLPDCLLLKIISRLLYTTKYVIKTTSTLSKRWQHLWTLLPTLYFLERDAVRFRRSHYYIRYTDFIDKTLAQCSTDVKLNKLVLSISYDSTEYRNIQWSLPINSCIRHAITRNVQEVCLSVHDSEEKEMVRYNDELLFNNSCITSMDIVDCVFDPPNGAIRWDTLKCLSISGGALDEDMIRTILSGSPVLETLNLNNCHGFKRIDVTLKSVKNLKFSTVQIKNRISDLWQYRDPIEINAPYILSLTINPSLYTEKLLLQNVSSLVKADIAYWNYRYYVDESREEELLKGLLQSLGHVKEITLGDYCFKVLSRLEATGFQFRKGLDLISRDLISRGRYLGNYRLFSLIH